MSNQDGLPGPPEPPRPANPPLYSGHVDGVHFEGKTAREAVGLLNAAAHGCSYELAGDGSVICRYDTRGSQSNVIVDFGGEHEQPGDREARIVRGTATVVNDNQGACYYCGETGVELHRNYCGQIACVDCWSCIERRKVAVIKKWGACPKCRTGPPITYQGSFRFFSSDIVACWHCGYPGGRITAAEWARRAGVIVVDDPMEPAPITPEQRALIDEYAAKLKPVTLNRKGIKALCDAMREDGVKGDPVDPPQNDGEASIGRTLELCGEAIGYVLERAQTDRDFGYQVGPGTQAFYLLVKAEVALLGVDLAEHEAERSKQFWREGGA